LARAKPCVEVRCGNSLAGDNLTRLVRYRITSRHLK
jgi:hypothetical protein